MPVLLQEIHRLSVGMASALFCASGLVCLAARAGVAQAAPAPATQPAPSAQTDSAGAGGGADPIAIVPIDANDPDGAATVTGALEVTGGKAEIAAGGSITSGARTAEVILPHRGVLRVCASTTVKLAADTSVPAGETPGLLMALDHGAVEMSFATTRAAGANADIVLTPDFRILIAGPGSAELKVRLGEGGDTCVDNSGINAPYVVVTSLFDPGLYRVQPGQRVMFQHGSLSEVVDEEKEPCGCPPPPAAQTAGNEFPLAQSEGLAPTPAPAPAPEKPAANVAPLVYSANGLPTAAARPPASPAAAPAAAQGNPPSKPTKQKKPGIFTRIGHFFRKVFGAE
jgi:hypothetical protein